VTIPHVINLQFSESCEYNVSANQCRFAQIVPWTKDVFIKNTTKTSFTNTNPTAGFTIQDELAKASYGMVRKIASQFSKAEKCPKDIKWGTIHGHFLQKLNDTKSPLTQGQVVKILAMKSLPSADLKAMRSYKKLVNLA
jgi:hypothetical protein